MNRITRSSWARLSASSDGQENRWISSIIDTAITKKITEEMNPVEEMAPGGALLRKKARYAPNHTSYNSAARTIARFPSDGPKESASNESKHMGTEDVVISSPQDKSTKVLPSPPGISVKQITQPAAAPTETVVRSSPRKKSTKVPSSPRGMSVKQKTPTAAAPTETAVRSSPRNKSSKVPSSPRKKSTKVPSSLPAMSVKQKTPTAAAPTETAVRSSPRNKSSKVPSSPPLKSLKNQSMPASATTESDGLQTDMVDHLIDEPDDNNQDADNNQNTFHEETEEIVADPIPKKRKRGPTTGKGLIKKISGSDGKKFKIEIDPVVGRPINRVQSAKFSSEVGVVARDILPVPKKWKDLELQSALAPCIDHMQIHMELNLENPGVRQSLIDRLKNSSRQQRYRLHVHFKRFANVREAKRNRPNSVKDQDQWELLCDHFDSEKFKNQSKANRGNRKNMKAKHATGRTPFTVIQNEISRKNGTACDRIELYRTTHQNANGKWSSDEAEENWKLMQQSKLKYEAEGVSITENDIAEQVLGKANGYVKGLGYGPKANGKRNALLQQQLEDTEAVLKEAQSENAAYKDKVDAMTQKFKEQEAKIDKLMAFMESGGRTGVEEEEEEEEEEDYVEDEF